MLKIYMLIIVVGLVGGVVYGGWYYYKDTQARIQILTENSAKLEQAAQLQSNTIATLEADAKKYAKLNNQLQTKLEKANEYRNTLISKLRKHDLARLSQQKPGLVEKRINNGTKKLLESFESLTAVTGVKQLQFWPQLKQIEVKTVEIERNVPIQNRPRQLDLSSIKWYVVTEENFEEFKKRFTAENGGFLFYAISIRDYETLTLNMADIKRYIEQQKNIIVYYEDAVKPREKEEVKK